MKNLITLLAIMLATSCVQEVNVVPKNAACPTYRIGAICNDGTSSNSTGSGTCSGHGGVRQWKCAK